MTDIDKAILTAMRGFLKTCKTGGMPIKQAEMIEEAVETAADLNYFSMGLVHIGIEK